MSIVWLILMVVLVVIEGATVALTTVWFAFACPRSTVATDPGFFGCLPRPTVLHKAGCSEILQQRPDKDEC